MQNIIGYCKIFDVDDERLVLSENCFNLSKLKDIMDAFPDDYMRIYRYIDFMTNPFGPFNNLPEDKKEEAIIDECGGKIPVENKCIVDAIEFIDQMYETPTKRFYLTNKILVDKLSAYAKDAEIQSGMHGNFKDLQAQIKSAKQMMEGLKATDSAYKEEIQEVLNRGNAYSGFDEDDDD